MSAFTVSNEILAWNYAKDGSFDALKQLYLQICDKNHRQWFLDMALMGSTRGPQPLTQESKDCKNWAWMNGACILWDIQQPGKEYEHVGNDGNNKLMRL